MVKVESVRKLKIGVIGMGRMGSIHVHVYSKIKNVKLKSISDIFRRRDVEKKYDARWYKDYEEMIETEDLDAVSICTPPYLHFKIAKNCLARGLSVFLEKPVCTSSREVRNIQKMSSHDSVMMPGYSLFFDESIQMLFSMMRKRELGKIIFGYFNMATPIPSASWYHRKSKSGGGVIVDKGTHIFPIVIRLFGMPKKIECEIIQIPWTQVEQKADIVLNYGDFNIYLILNWLQSKAFTRMEIHGTGSSFIADNYGGTDFISEAIYAHTIRLPKLAYKLTKTLGITLKNRLLDAEALIYENELRTFVNLVGMKNKRRTKSRVIPSLADAVKTWELVEEIYKKAEVKDVSSSCEKS